MGLETELLRDLSEIGKISLLELSIRYQSRVPNIFETLASLKKDKLIDFDGPPGALKEMEELLAESEKSPNNLPMMEVPDSPNLEQVTVRLSEKGFYRFTRQ
jgi:hypothetical protein